MKISHRKKTAGVVLLVALFVIVAAGIVLASYLALMQTEKKSVSRSQTWNNCVPIMEAGVEEAMAQIHYCGNTTNFSSNSWTLTNGYYQKMRSMATDGSYCVVQIQPATPPIIYATAYVPVPDTATNYIHRTVRVTTQTKRNASGGLTSKGSINFSGGAQFDSYDSSVAPYDPLHPGTNALALTDSTASGAVSLSGGNIYGMAVTGPGGSVAVNGSAAVGSASWNASSTGIEPGWSANDANVQINDVGAPSTTNGWTPALNSGTNSGTNYTYLLSYAKSSYLSLTIPGNLTIQAGQSLGIFGPCTLWVSNLTVSGTGFIYMAPGASLTLYVSGAFDVSGGGIVNMSGYAANLSVNGLPTCTMATYSGGATFIGSVDTPEANFTFNGGSGAYGQFTASTITVSGSGGVHYDQALGSSGAIIAASWNEL
jgi:hypothetical protein